MKVLWLSENGLTGKVDRNFSQMRTEFAWIVGSDGKHYNIGDLINIPINTYDVAIIILPKRENILQQISTYDGFDLIGNMKRVAKKIGWMQEGPIIFYQDYTIPIQMWWYSILSKMDFLMIHNEKDGKYIEGLYNVPTFVNRSLMIDDAIDHEQIKIERKNMNNVCIGGNFCSWYGGFDSYMVASTFNQKIFVPSMGRMLKDEEYLEGITHIKYKDWTNWISTLAGFKYAIHLMSTHAAGTFALNCAYLSIPCIGYKGLDTQEVLHPELTVDLHNIKAAKKLAMKLKEDSNFYQHCSNVTQEMYDKYYPEEVWKERFFTFLTQILHEDKL